LDQLNTAFSRPRKHSSAVEELHQRGFFARAGISVGAPTWIRSHFVRLWDRKPNNPAKMVTNLFIPDPMLSACKFKTCKKLPPACHKSGTRFIPHCLLLPSSPKYFVTHRRAEKQLVIGLSHDTFGGLKPFSNKERFGCEVLF